MLCIYPGSFDPMTYGHLDIIKRAAMFSKRLTVAVLQNSAKAPLFDTEERMEILRESVLGLTNVEVDSFSGLLVNYAKEKGANIIIRGLRAVTDFEYEFQMALANRLLSNDSDLGLETLFIPTSTEYLYLGSGLVKEISMHGGDISKMAPRHVVSRIYQKLKSETTVIRR